MVCHLKFSPSVIESLPSNQYVYRHLTWQWLEALSCIIVSSLSVNGDRLMAESPYPLHAMTYRLFDTLYDLLAPLFELVAQDFHAEQWYAWQRLVWQCVAAELGTPSRVLEIDMRPSPPT
jgi:hypothetical protein